MEGNASRSRLFIACALVVAMLAGCSSQNSYPSAPAGATTTAGQQLERQRQQARDDLTRWADAVAAAGGDQGVVIVGEATSQIGDWEEPVGNNSKIALMSGRVEDSVGLSTEVPTAAQVRWQDGSVRIVPTISAARALADLQAAAVQPCPECDALQVTDAKLTTVQIQTSRGLATMPAWEFSLQGTAVRVTRVAIAERANVRVSPPPWDPNDPPVGLSIDSASGKVDSRELTATLLGAPAGGDEPCGADYTAEAVESPLAVVVIVIEHRNTTNAACDLMGHERTATVELAAPLGTRTVLDVKEGLPVPLTLAR